jgi:nucleoside-diphosphate-sugar epimerase
LKILITGGNGSLGSNLVEHLLPKDHEILIIDNYETSSKGIFPENLKNLTIVEGSIENQELVESCFSKFKPTHVIHSAASYKDPNNWVQDVNTNVNGTIHVLKTAAKYSIQKLIYFQTALCYGRPDSVPIPITHRTNPFTSYGISKTAGELFALSSGLPVISLRLANVTGPRLSIGPIPTFYKRIKAGQSCFCSKTIRDFLDMSDFLSFMDIALKDGSPLGVYNLSTGEGRSIKEIFQIVAEHLGYKGEMPPEVEPGADDVPAVVLDPSKTEKDFAWKAKVPFKEIITNLLKWYDKHGISAVYSHLSDPTAK